MLAYLRDDPDGWPASRPHHTWPCRWPREDWCERNIHRARWAMCKRRLPVDVRACGVVHILPAFSPTYLCTHTPKRRCYYSKPRLPP